MVNSAEDVAQETSQNRPSKMKRKFREFRLRRAGMNKKMFNDAGVDRRGEMTGKSARWLVAAKRRKRRCVQLQGSRFHDLSLELGEV